MSKSVARLVIAIVSAGLVLHVVASTVGSHYYRMTYGVCLADGFFAGQRCTSWTLQGLFEILAIVALGIAAWVWNERR